MSDSTCPKCSGPREAKALYCPFCGVVFSRFEGGGASAAPAPVPARPAAASVAAPAEGFRPEPVNPYQAPTASVAPRHRPEPGAAQQRATLAGRGTRLGAQMLDGLSLAALTVTGVVLASLLSDTPSGGEPPTAIYAVVGMAILLLLGVNLYLLADRGQTIGKMLVKVRIVRTTGERVSLGRILFLRMAPINVLSAIPYLGVLISFVNVLMIFGEERRCLHDHFADTIVVNA